MNLFHVLLTPFIAAVFCLLFRQNQFVQKWLGLFFTGLFLILSAGLLWEVDQAGDLAGKILVQQAGGWPAPFGISLVADRLSAVMVFITAFVGFVTCVYAFAPHQRNWQGAEFQPLLQFLLAGVTGAFLTGDLFNLYVFFEILLIASFGLMVQGREPAQFAAGVKYAMLSLLASMVFLAGLGFLYNGTGSLNMADVGRYLSAGDWSITTYVAFLMLMFAFAAKAGLFPLYFWLPSSYPKTPILTAALFAGLLTKVGVYALIRLFILPGEALPESILQIMLVLSLLTMLVGVLSAASKGEIRNILSFHIISQIGYITLGLAFMTKAALVGTVFYLIHHIVVKANLFLVAGVVDRIFGSTTLKKIGGLRSYSYWLAIFFLIPALSLAGIPPLSGFWAKLLVLKAALQAGSYWALGVGLAVGLFTLFSMIKIWNEAFWKEHHEELPPADLKVREKAPMYFGMALFCAWTLVMGFGIPWSYGFAERTSEQLLNRGAYASKVLDEQNLETPEVSE